MDVMFSDRPKAVFCDPEFLATKQPSDLLQIERADSGRLCDETGYWRLTAFW